MQAPELRKLVRVDQLMAAQYDARLRDPILPSPQYHKPL